MKKLLLCAILFLSVILESSSQESGVVALDIPSRNSLKFNKYTINPTFSFVREQNKYITLYNKRQWIDFEDAPLTYLVSYTGRIKENMGMGVGLFQQDYGVLTTFGGIVNFAYNAVLDTDSNLTFGINLAYYQSGINDGRVNVNFPDPALDNIPSNSIITINPGINYGLAFLDFGVSVNNAVSYNLLNSEIIEENPEQSIQPHVMYTGYINSRGFFDESKFSGLLQSEFKKEETIFSGLAMLSVPRGIWAQVGYNTLYGLSGGLGLNITNQIAIEYNYEKAMGELSNFGSSHEITLAYKFVNKKNYKYSGDDEEVTLFENRKGRKVLASSVNHSKRSAEQKQIEAQKVAQANNEAKQLAENAKLEEQKNTQENRDEAKLEAERLANEERLKEEEANRLAAEQQAQLEAERLANEERLKEEEANRLAAEQQAQLRGQRLANEERLKEEEANRLAAEQQAKIEAEQLVNQEPTKEEEDVNIGSEALDAVIIPVPKDEATQEIRELTKLTVDTKLQQQKLLLQLKETVANKNQDLKDLKEENDLFEQGVYLAPKPFKSITAENASIETLKSEIEEVISSQNKQIKTLEDVYMVRLKSDDVDDVSSRFYTKTINNLRTQQKEAIRAKDNLISDLDKINAKIEVERKRRIRRAVYNNEQDRYLKDRAALNQIKQFTPLSSSELTEEDFDSGDVGRAKIEIVKGVRNTEPGFYVIVAAHTDVEKRDTFLRNAVSVGQDNIDFFYDVNSSKYYIYYEKFESIQEATTAIELKGTEPYNAKMSIVKIEN